MWSEFNTFKRTKRKESDDWTTLERTCTKIISDLRSITLSIISSESNKFSSKTNLKGDMNEWSTVSNALRIWK